MLKIVYLNRVEIVPTNAFEFGDPATGIPEWNFDLYENRQVPWTYHGILDIATPIHAQFQAAATNVLISMSKEHHYVNGMLTLKDLLKKNLTGKSIGMSARIAAIKKGDFSYLKGIKV